MIAPDSTSAENLRRASGRSFFTRPFFREDFWICLILVLATLAVYAAVGQFNFVNYDDSDYVSKNPHVQQGISAESLKWALTSGEHANWFPLTRLSFILQYPLSGLGAGGYHVVNLALHALASVLLFVFLLRATQQRWPAAFVAFLFALHPLHVESVAWVSERKDVLCAVFWFLTLWAWVRYTELPGLRRYFLALLLFAMGLMSKPMIVTLPFLLLLLDAWPLRRKFTSKLLLEKVPFLALSAAACVVTFLAQQKDGAVQPLAQYPLGLRIENALITSVVYIVQMFWPGRLAVLYPYPRQLPLWEAAAAGLALACLTALVLRCFRTRPYLAVGWFWYLGTLVPVIGLVQVGIQARADRYTYVPSVGLAIMLAWGAADAVRHWSPVMPRLRVWVSVAATLILLALALVAWRQVQYWQSGETLFRHTIAVTGPNPKAWQNLGTALLIEHRTSDAIAAYEGGLRVDSNDADLHCNLAVTLMTQDLNANFPRAVDHLRTALRIDPNSADAHSNLAVALSKTGHLAQAVEEDRAVVRIRPDSAAGHADLAAVLYTAGQWSEAIEEAKTALRIDPDSAAAHCALAASLLALNTEPSEEAVEHLRQALRIQPDYVEALANLGVALARIPGATFESIFEFEEALRIDPAYRPAQIDLGFSLAQIPGRRREALAHLRIALRLRPDPKLQQKLEQIESAPSPAEQ